MILSNQLAVTVNYDESDGVKNYEVKNGNDSHGNSRPRRRQDWEYVTWPLTPFTPLDNLAWFGWDRFKGSAEAARQDPSKTVEIKYLGWSLHGLGDATVPMHVTSAFGWGHRPYEDAVSDPDLGRQLLGDGDIDAEVEQAIDVLRAAGEYRKSIQEWRRGFPERRADIPIRNLVTTLAKNTLTASQGKPSVYNDALSSAYVIPGPSRGLSIEAYKIQRTFMRERVLDTVAATVAFLMSAAEVLP
jgi:hypothetical protein